ncbi:hypothetical protein NHH03_14650 [Stieleria sp. TO1_6]|uniref:GAP1-N2 domain-containing protein n=1 Tax=Stieleria tagensis TaxID=2956795 RepID=UPI00209B127D|nr:hypothetical protein [Stieleria tagensis]MCO8122985.1 hypothetical protein [Stieleria tagensis]
MSTELLYTSAPQGLRHGSRGFCTVLTTAGMPINVIGRLESISGYSPVFANDSAHAAQNPVAYSHQRLNLGGQLVSVLSRVAAYGTDYSGRSNKIAHHVTVDPTEMSAAGPAWVLQQPSVIRSEWLGQCETPAVGPTIPRHDQSPRICSAWKGVVGDAGWGGVVAEAFVSNDVQPLWIIYPIEQREQLLELVDESIALLPVNQRWRATFNTYAVNVPPDVQCKIRFVPVGTEAARFAASSDRAIDLTKAQSITTASRWVERARGVIRGEPEAAPTNSFTAVQDSAPEQSVESAWSPLDQTATSPPAIEQPPELPADFGAAGQRRKNWVVGLVAFALLLGLGATWAVARHLAGLPILPSDSPELPSPPAPVAPVESPVPATEAPSPQPTPQRLVVIPLHYDQKQILRWASELSAAKSDSADAALPQPIELRGKVRIESSEQNSQTAGPAESTLFSWGGETRSLGTETKLRLSTNSLAERTGEFVVQSIPGIPEIAPSTKLFWAPEQDDLIAVAELDWSQPAEPFTAQAAAYRNFSVGLAKILELVQAIKQDSGGLPSSLRVLTESFLTRSLHGDEAFLRSLIRNPSTGASLAGEATALSEALQSKVQRTTEPIEQQEQAALLRLVSSCERIAQAADELNRSFSALQTGQTIEVPDLQFFDAKGVLLRRISLRFRFSW